MTTSPFTLSFQEEKVHVYNTILFTILIVMNEATSSYLIYKIKKYLLGETDTNFNLSTKTMIHANHTIFAGI